MALYYSNYISQIANLMPIGSTDAGFQTMVPGMIDYAEQRLYRELDLLYTQTTDATGQTSSDNRNFALPTSVGTFITADQMNVITPAGTQSSAGTRVPLVPVSREFIDITYPSGQTATGVPAFYAMASNTETILGPAPDDAYYVEVVGIQRPSALSSNNSSTILTQYVPDLMIAASMIFVSGYMRNFGPQGDDPKMGASWESQYQTLMKSASVEQARAKFESEGWTSESPSPVATPPRV